MKHLIHIGFPKAASTFLQEWFRRHPELFYQHGALAGFYNIYEISRRASTPEAEANYKYYVTSDESLVFPKPSTGGYAVENGAGMPVQKVPYTVSQKRVCQMLKDIFPNASVLLITRGFKNFILSGYSQYVRAGGTLGLEDLLQMSRDSDEAAQQSVDYDYIYQLYASAFGEENLIVLPFELLRDDQKRFFSTLEERLGLEPFKHNIGRINESLSDEELYWYPRISRRVSRLAQKLGEARYARVYGWYIHQTLNRRLEKIARALCYLRKAETLGGSDIPAEFIEQCRGRASVFSGNPLYESYRAEYLLDERRAEN